MFLLKEALLIHAWMVCCYQQNFVSSIGFISYEELFIFVRFGHLQILIGTHTGGSDSKALFSAEVILSSPHQ